MSKFFRFLSMVLLILFSTSCSDDIEKKEAKSSPSKSQEIFDRLDAKASGIEFSNDLKEDSIINYFTYPYIYMGGGVATGDLNNDGFPDLYFTGNMVSNKLYLNKGVKGSPEFIDITEQANVAADNRWVTGVTMADVNADGWLDIYVSVSGKFETTKNLLYINTGKLKEGIPSFTEEAEQRGIADEGRSTQGTFFDYDQDGDLDLYVVNYPFTSFKTPNYSYKIFMEQKQLEKSDHLFQNDGSGNFKDVTGISGIQNFGLGLSATAGDINNDGWDDLYVSNDFASPDFIYKNNGDGTFTDITKESTQHTAFFGMGTDIADINNDGLFDILQMDMTPKDNRRNKANMASMNVNGFWEMVNFGFHYQYMQNAIQINQGITQDGIPHFSDISRMAGMSSTDWSWAVLCADLDNDGRKDVFISNGTRRDINNKDYFNGIDNALYAEKQKFTNLGLTINMPSERIDNYTYRNLGNLKFESINKDWGLEFEGYSNGATYSDLDLDGDLDLVINNIDDKAIIFKNTSSDNSLANFFDVTLKGPEKNNAGIGTKIQITTEDGTQYAQQTLTRGFQSGTDANIHFGIGTMSTIDNLTVTWPDGKIQSFQALDANQKFIVDYASNSSLVAKNNKENEPKLFQDITELSNVDHLQKENEYDDYKRELLLPHTYSANGPAMTVGDVNGDDREDFFIGGALGQVGVLYIQAPDGTFRENDSQPWEAESNKEDMGSLFFDADNDNDLDLFISSGGNEYAVGDQRLVDRLYINDGKGKFTKSTSSLPAVGHSSSRVKAADFDNDGDLDLFVGGRVVPGAYPTPAKSFLYRNDGVKNNVPSFVDVSDEMLPELDSLGLVTDAVWVDYNQDDKLDLIVVGEWMPITFFMNQGDKFVDQTEALGFAETSGWWYSIVAEDFDKDGKVDLALGNLGLNYKYQADPEETFDIYAHDYDKNGKLDIVLGYYNEGVQYPVRGRQCSSEQIPTIKYKYKNYNAFASASLQDIYTEGDLKNSMHFQAKTFAHTFLKNLGNGKFEKSTLPNAAQISSINGFIVDDFNKDGNLDLIAAGNIYGAEVETTRNDAGYGYYLAGDGKGQFKSVPFSETGLFIKGDVKDIALINTKKGKVIIAGKNQDRLQLILAKD